ncbi:MAG: LysR family transcriptional regulator [Gammaproteobacteria bacterium]|nr:MAG: LysR family transcriptional regulator [Gammaproteobacteria bacterium]
MRLDIENFYILKAIIEENSFSKAAEKLHRTQSSVSYQIKKLENNLGIEIFDRNDYRAKLTEGGEVIWAEGQRLMKMTERIHSLATSYQGGWEPKLEVVIDGALPAEPVMHALKVISDKAIATKFQVKMEFLGGVQLRFEEDQADFMIVMNYKPSPVLHAVPLKEKLFILVASKNHLLSQEKVIKHNHLLDHVELTIQDSSGSPVDELQFGCDRVFSLSDFAYKKSAMLVGLGFGWMPEELIRQELESGELIELNYVGGSRHVFTPHLVYSIDKPLGKTGEIFRELILETL